MVHNGTNHSNAGPWAIELKALSKAFGECVANADISLKVKKGSIHGIIGENGAGKSTAMKMLYGIYAPDTGDILLHGQKKNWQSPADAIAAGIGMVHQHFMLAGPYSALDNILLGKEPIKGFGPWAKIDRNKAQEKLEVLMKQYLMPVDLKAPIEELPVGLQQRIEILKLLYREADILILDEPTAVLTPQEIQGLFSNLKRMRDEGKTIIIITHKLKEVMSLTDRITVFRQGRISGELETKDTNEQALADLMVGRKVMLHAQRDEKTQIRQECILEIKNLAYRHAQSGKEILSGLNLNLHGGEIVGIAGVEGNGQCELLHALYSPQDFSLAEGTLFFKGEDISHAETRELRRKGLALIPADRHKEGLLLDRPLWENFLLGHEEAYSSRFGLIQHKKLLKDTETALDTFDVRPRLPHVHARGLSGGNQQKLILAREFFHGPKLMLIAHPSRGVDVGSIEFIHQQILQAKKEGKAILLISSELEEVMNLSDRLLVMYEGRFVAQFEHGQYDEKTVGLAMGGGKHAH